MIMIGQTAGLFATGTLLTISFRILTIWIYNNTGHSVFATILFHAVTNTGRSVFPGSRAGIELGDAAIAYSIVMFTAFLVAAFWDAETLTRFPDRGHEDKG